MDRTLSCATCIGHSEPGSDGNEGVFYIPGASPSDCLMSYPGHLLEESCPSVEMHSVYSTAPANWVDFFFF